MRLQFWHIVVLVLIIVILFGAKRLPDVASSVGKSLKIFKKEVTELTKDDDEKPGDATTTNTTQRNDTPSEFRPGGDPGRAPNPPGAPGSDTQR